jgi:hypothetical protein
MWSQRATLAASRPALPTYADLLLEPSEGLFERSSYRPLRGARPRVLCNNMLACRSGRTTEPKACAASL